MRTNLTRVVAVLAFAALPLSACSVPAEPTDAPAEVVEESAPGTEEDMPLETVEPEPEYTAPEETEPAYETGTFGKTGFTWDDGIEVQISKPKEFTPSEWASFEPAAKYIQFEVTLTNGSNEPFDPSSFYTTASSGGVEAAEVFDSENGFDGAPMTRILPGKSVTFKVGYGVESAKDTVLDVTPSYDHSAVLFTAEGGDAV